MNITCKLWPQHSHWAPFDIEERYIAVDDPLQGTMNIQFAKVVGCKCSSLMRSLRLSFPGFVEDANLVLYKDLTSPNPSPSRANNFTLLFLERCNTIRFYQRIAALDHCWFEIAQARISVNNPSTQFFWAPARKNENVRRTWLRMDINLVPTFFRSRDLSACWSNRLFWELLQDVQCPHPNGLAKLWKVCLLDVEIALERPDIESFKFHYCKLTLVYSRSSPDSKRTANTNMRTRTQYFCQLGIER